MTGGTGDIYSPFRFSAFITKMDTKEFIEFIFRDEKLKNSTSFKQMLLNDVPVVSTASQLKRPSVPKPIKDMKALSYREDLIYATTSKLFYEQGILMKDYTDDIEYDASSIEKYYPIYNNLDTNELRAYFTWRTRVRNGELPGADGNFSKVCQAFVTIYIYELINGIGVPSPEKGYEMLCEIIESYRDMFPFLRYAGNDWKFDYVVYNRLAPELLSEHPTIKLDHDILTLTEPENADPGELTAAIIRVSSYNLEKSRFFRIETEDMKRVLRDVYIQLNDFYKKHRKNSLAERLFGKMTNLRYYPFKNAVFYERYPKSTFVYRVDPIHLYRRSSDIWYCERYYYFEKANSRLGDITKTVDCIMREKYGYRYKLKSGYTSKLVNELISKIVTSLLEEKERNKRPEIKIDVSKLSAIRRVSEETRDKLIVEEEMPEAAPVPPVQPVQPVKQPEGPEDQPAGDVLSESVLTAAELAFLAALLNGENAADAAGKAGVMPSLLADSINEKLFDEFSDNVIDFDGDDPFVIEDYADALTKIVRQ